MLSSLLLLLASPAAPTGVIFVDDSATGVNDGSSWADAFVDLQDALAVALPSDQVWVAQGLYRPTAGLDRDASFEPRGALYGGFAGHEATLEERAGLVERTILSGDLLGDDGPGFVGYADNSFHVVVLSGGATGPWPLVDGFTITGGNADGTWGGGVVAAGVDRFRLRKCRLVRNRGSGGGGLAVILAGGRIEDCVFLGNESLGGGGGLYVDIALSVRVERCWFLGNHARYGGGGGVHAFSPVVLLDCVFSGNAARGPQGGGGLFASAPPTVIGCTFAHNSAVGSGAGGGGVLAKGSPSCAQPNLVDSILWGNVDDGGGGQDAQVSAWGSGPPPVLAWSCVQGWVGLACSLGVFDADPLFLDPLGPDGVAGTLDDLLELDLASPCIDAGRHARAFPGVYTPVPSSPLDAAGKRRFVDLLSPGDGAILDLGALERTAAP